MVYNSKVQEYCLSPKNCRSMDKNDPNIGFGKVGSAACGDFMYIFLRIENNIITDASFKTFGCGSAIAASSLGTELTQGKSLDRVEKDVTNDKIFSELKLPPIKRHCSILVEEGIKDAIRDYNSPTKKAMRANNM